MSTSAPNGQLPNRARGEHGGGRHIGRLFCIRRCRQFRQGLLPSTAGLRNGMGKVVVGSEWGKTSSGSARLPVVPPLYPMRRHSLPTNEVDVAEGCPALPFRAPGLTQSLARSSSPSGTEPLGDGHVVTRLVQHHDRHRTAARPADAVV